MRTLLILSPLALAASPALAQTAATATSPAPAATAVEDIRIPPELTDPRMAARLGDMMQILSKALLDLPVGSLQAAAEGRKPTAADRRRTVRDMGRADNPDFDRDVERQVAGSGAMVQAGMKAMAAALPAMMKGMSDAARELDKATANLPRPNYPRQ